MTNLWHSYGKHYALSNINFSVPRASITAVVGPNGAGKSTLFKCLMGLESPIMGAISIDGTDVIGDPRAIYGKIAYLAEDIGIYDDLTIKQSLHYAASLHLMSKEDASQSIYKLTTALAITDRLDVKLSALSKGLKQSVAIAQAIIHNPSVILLDEPSSGLDPEARHRVISLFGQLQGNGATLLISTHVLSEIESYCSDILIIKDGRLLKFDDMNQDLPDSTLLKLKMSEGLASTVNMLKSNPNISRIEKITGGVQFYFTGNKEQQAELLNHLVAVNATISSFEVVCKNLQDKYLASIRKDKGL